MYTTDILDYSSLISLEETRCNKKKDIEANGFVYHVSLDASYAKRQ